MRLKRLKKGAGANVIHHSVENQEVAQMIHPLVEWTWPLLVPLPNNNHNRVSPSVDSWENRLPWFSRWDSGTNRDRDSRLGEQGMSDYLFIHRSHRLRMCCQVEGQGIHSLIAATTL